MRRAFDVETNKTFLTPPGWSEAKLCLTNQNETLRLSSCVRVSEEENGNL